MTLYLDSLQPLLPDAIRTQLDHAFMPEIKTIVDAMLRLVVGAEAPASGVLPGWEDLQSRASKIVDDLKRGEQTRSSQKRARDDEDSASSKRAKTDSGLGNDQRVFSLQGISVSTPIRKKVNIDIYRSTVRLTNPSSQKEEFPPIPLSVLQRAFLLPTRGKSKPHWTVILLSSDVPAAVPKGPGAAAAAKDTSIPQLVFGLDATLTTILNTSTPDSEKSYPKGQPSLPALRAFFSHLPISVLEPSTSVFKSAAGSQENGGVAGVEAYRGAKEGTLWFLDGGVLWDGKPCEFFALEHLAPASKSDQPIDGVRTLTATGRTCSVILRRIRGHLAKDAAESKGKAKANGKGEEDEDDEEDEGVDVDFGMVDGREQEPIGRWIKARRNRFGRVLEPPSGSTSNGNGGLGPAVDKGKGKATTHEEDPRNEDTEDEEDEDFEMDSSGDSDETGSEADDSDASQDGGEDEDGEGNASDDATGDEMDDEEELDPKHHPLLRPGAMPRMSRAAIEAVVGVVERDMMNAVGAAATSAADSEEEDELDD